MALKHLGFIELPAHVKPGGFDHAAVHAASGRVFVAHTCNDALDVIDGVNELYLHSIPNLIGVAGELVADERNLVLTSNRGENTVGIFTPDDETGIVRVSVGVRPNGLAYDSGRNLLLAANVGDPAVPGSFTVSLVDVAQRIMTASVPVPGRTRWTIFDPLSDRFYVNIMEPAQIVVVDATQPAQAQVERVLDIPAAGPHGLDLDAAKRRLFCACDGKKLVTLAVDTGRVLDAQDIAGVPDVIFFNAALEHLYVAIGDPGVIEVFDTRSMRRIETVSTEKGAHTLAFDAERNKVYAFLPQTHKAAVYVDTWT
jgi:DNA-binding beta-propeller fold protein YncE